MKSIISRVGTRLVRSMSNLRISFEYDKEYTTTLSLSISQDKGLSDISGYISVITEDLKRDIPYIFEINELLNLKETPEFVLLYDESSFQGLTSLRVGCNRYNVSIYKNLHNRHFHGELAIDTEHLSKDEVLSILDNLDRIRNPYYEFSYKDDGIRGIIRLIDLDCSFFIPGRDANGCVIEY